VPVVTELGKQRPGALRMLIREHDLVGVGDEAAHRGEVSLAPQAAVSDETEHLRSSMD
jgi:hypothetical protein